MNSPKSLSRKDLIRSVTALAAASLLPKAGAAPALAAPTITIEDLAAYEKIAGIEFTAEERKSILANVREYVGGFDTIRKQDISERDGIAVVFRPIGAGSEKAPRVQTKISKPSVQDVRGLTDEDIAFLPLRELGHLLRTRKITSVSLTRLYLSRLKLYGPKLNCVVNLMEESALKHAAEADREIASGKYRGPLHGIPCGVKDLLATKGTKTTWGAAPYSEQMLDYDAAVIERLREARAVVVVKLSMGALAYGDFWFGGLTKNPWNPVQGSSGSSAGSAAATAAGLVAFSIGTETLGSIVSPSERCRTTGFRPTFGRVSRYGAMELCATMDKIGPICREVEDCALVFAAICGEDARDPSTVGRSFRYAPARKLTGKKIGYTSELKPEHPFLKNLAELGATLVPIKFAPIADGIPTILEVEASSAFEEFTRTRKIDEMKGSLWPPIFRAARFVPAVEYLQAMRARTQLMERFEKELGDVDAVVSLGIGQPIVHVNFTGHPQVILPQGDDGKGNSRAVSIIGRLYQDDRLLEIAKLAQDATEFHRRRPDLRKLG